MISMLVKSNKMYLIQIDLKKDIFSHTYEVC